MTNDSNFTVVEHNFRNRNDEEEKEIRSSLVKAAGFVTKEAEESARCLVAFTINADGTPSLILAGKIDPLECMGFLEVVKMDLMQRMFSEDVEDDA